MGPRAFVACVAIVCIALLGAVAIYKGIDTGVLTITVGAIGTIAGWVIRGKLGK